MGTLPGWLTGALRAHLGDAYYNSLEDLIIQAPLVWEFVQNGER